MTGGSDFQWFLHHNYQVSLNELFLSEMPNYGFALGIPNKQKKITFCTLIIFNERYSMIITHTWLVMGSDALHTRAFLVSTCVPSSFVTCRSPVGRVVIHSAFLAGSSSTFSGSSRLWALFLSFFFSKDAKHSYIKKPLQ